MKLIEAGNMEFDALNPLLNLVNRVLLNSQAKTKAMGVKKARNINENNSSIPQSPSCLPPHLYYPMPSAGLGYSPMPPYFMPPFM